MPLEDVAMLSVPPPFEAALPLLIVTMLMWPAILHILVAIRCEWRLTGDGG